MAMADSRRASRPMRLRARDETTPVHPMAAANALRDRPLFPGYFCGETVHLPAPISIEAEGQALGNRPGPVAPLGGPASLLWNAVRHPVRLCRLTSPLPPHRDSPPLHRGSTPSLGWVQVSHIPAPLHVVVTRPGPPTVRWHIRRSSGHGVAQGQVRHHNPLVPPWYAWPFFVIWICSSVRRRRRSTSLT